MTMPPSGPWRSGSGRMIGPLQQGDTRRGRRHRPGRHHRPVPPYPQHRLCPDGLMFVQAIHRPDYFRENTTLARVVQVRFNTSAALWFRTGYGLAGVVCRCGVSVGCVGGLCRWFAGPVVGSIRGQPVREDSWGRFRLSTQGCISGRNWAQWGTGPYWGALGRTEAHWDTGGQHLGAVGIHWGALGGWVGGGVMNRAMDRPWTGGWIGGGPAVGRRWIGHGPAVDQR